MPGQHRAGEVVEASRASFAPIPLSVNLALIKAVSDHGIAAARGAVDTLRPAMLAYQGEALGIVDQRREVDQIRYRHIRGSSRRVAGSRRPRPTITEVLQARYPDLLPPPRNPIRALLIYSSAGDGRSCWYADRPAYWQPHRSDTACSRARSKRAVRHRR